MSVAITLAPSGNQSGGNVADTITTADYADTDAVYTALGTGTASTAQQAVLKVNTQINADGTTISKKRLIPLVAIKQIVSL